MNNHTTATQAIYYGIGGVIYAFVSTVWLAIATFLSESNNLILSGTGVVVVVALAVMSIRFIRNAPRPTSEPDSKKSMWFGIVFAWEGIGIGVSSGILVALGMAQWIPVAVVIIVGLHFFPLARILNTPLDNVLGAMLILLGVLTPIVVADSTVWIPVIAYGAALLLALAGFSRLRIGTQLD